MKTIRNSKGTETIIYAESFEQEAWEQVKRMCSFEAYEMEKIRIMPDAHVGKGCTVGTTMTITDKITPNLVGVDIGCFTGDTKIPLLNGSQKTLKELAEQADPIYVYSLDEHLNPAAGLAIPKLTRKNASLLKITISGGEEIRCTPDHKFMLLDGSYKEAGKLKKLDSLMPLYRTYESEDGYEHIKASTGTGIATYSIESLNYTEDVYCLTVEQYHNFALAAGVFVHNCGMLSVVLKDQHIDFEKLDETINTKIPSGFNVHSKAVKDFDFSYLRCQRQVDLQRAMLSIGTLGGGNHFIEVGRAESTGEIYLIIHSGSRKLGGDVCKHYQDKAGQQITQIGKIKKALIKQLKAEGREKEIDAALHQLKNPAAVKELAYLTGEDFMDYMNDMAIVQKFASLNRETMAEIILREMNFTEASRFETIHNYIDFRRMILRKGAVSSEKGEKLLIPINMRDGSLLCIGKGNEQWNYSAPHGAGRLMSRSKAKEAIAMDDFVKSMKDVYSTSVVTETLDEAPQAYKPIEEIKAAITDTVDIVGVIKPLYNYKAH